MDVIGSDSNREPMDEVAEVAVPLAVQDGGTLRPLAKTLGGVVSVSFDSIARGHDVVRELVDRHQEQRHRAILSSVLPDLSPGRVV